MTDEQIIKAFEEMAEDNRMPIINQCICSDVLNLINRQKAEIERLKNKNTLLLKKKCKDINTARKIIKSEAIKEFAERLKRTSIGLEIGDDKKFKMTIVSTVAIDNLVKEMTEGL